MGAVAFVFAQNMGVRQTSLLELDSVDKVLKSPRAGEHALEGLLEHGKFLFENTNDVDWNVREILAVTEAGSNFGPFRVTGHRDEKRRTAGLCGNGERVRNLLRGPPSASHKGGR
jgi:hypothetical protein